MVARCVTALVGVFLLGSLQGHSAAQTPQQQVMSTFKELIQAHVTRDVATASRIYHENLSYGHNNGQIDTKDFALKDLQNGMWVGAQIVDANVTVTGPVAVVRSTMNMGKDCTKPAQTCGVRVLWVFVQERGAWQVLARQANQSFNNPTVLCCAHAAAAKAAGTIR